LKEEKEIAKYTVRCRSSANLVCTVHSKQVHKVPAGEALGSAHSFQRTG
jgi:hypothetical protein